METGDPKMTELDINFVRAQFPAFSQPALQGQAFFENAGGSYTCAQVIDRLHRFYTERKVQPYGFFPASRAGGEEMDEAQSRLAALMNVETDELSFGPSTSQNTYVLAQAFAAMLSPGDAIIVTDQDHEANTGVWRRLADRGIEVREWHVDPELGQLNTADLAQLLDGPVKLVCFPHCSNIVGQENPVAEIVAMAHAAGAVTCVDGVSMAPHGLPDIAALGTDIYLFSSYKTYGPHQGVMIVRRALADRLPNQGHFFNAGARTKRFTPAGPDHAQIAAAAGMADYIDALYSHHYGADSHTADSHTGDSQGAHSQGGDSQGGDSQGAHSQDGDSKAHDAAHRGRSVCALQRAYEDKTLAPLLDWLRGRNDLRILGNDHIATATGRVPTVALHTNRPAAAIATDLAAHGVMAGAGDFYAVRTIGALGCDPEAGVLRLSFVHYTSADEIQQLIKGLDATL
jgi:selenocysteine lyase/cysteine desulfurase